MRNIIGTLAGAWAGALLVGTIGGWVSFLLVLHNASDISVSGRWIGAYLVATAVGAVVGGWVGYAASGTHYNR